MALQAGFNRRGMQRSGVWFALVPWLSRLDSASRRAWLVRERAVFNTNPYLAPVLLGARCRIEEDHSPELAERVDATLQRSLGSLGDALTWRAARPVWFLATALAGFAFGPAAVLIAWLLFAIAVALVHRNGLDWGYRLGLDVVDQLEAVRLHALARAGRRTAAVLAGAVGVGILVLALISGAERAAVFATAIAIGLGAVTTRLRRGPEWVLFVVMAGMVLYARWTGSFPEAVVTWR
jgi:mannose/fructose/N-acetylgalactosamine-specific phosphotransferase system component IID